MVSLVGVAGATDNALTVNVPWTHYGTADPITIAAGDVGILAWNGQSSPTWTAPSGWTLAAPEVIGTTGSHRSRVYVRALDGTEAAAPVALTASAINKMMGMLYVARGVDVADIIDAIASRDETITGTSHACPQITTVAPDAPVLTIIHERLTDSSTAYTAPSPGYTKRLQVTPIGGGGSVSGAIADDGLAVSRSAGTNVTPPAWTNGASTNNVITWTISLTPSSTPSGSGAITATAALTGSGSKTSSGTATATATATVTAAGTKAAAGSGTITATATLAGAGTPPVVTAPDVPVFVPGVPVGTLPAAFNELIRDTFTALLAPPVFRARRTTALTVAENTVQAIAWNSAGIDEDTHSGWASGQATRWTVPAGWPGWWHVTAAVSLSGTGAANLILIPSISTNGGATLPSGVLYEGQEVFVPTGGGQAKTVPSEWWVYAAPGDYLELLLYYSNESAITAVDTSAGMECRLELIWDGI